MPKAKQTAAMSGAGFMRLVKNVGDSISKVAGKKSETDAVREDKGRMGLTYSVCRLISGLKIAKWSMKFWSII